MLGFNIVEYPKILRSLLKCIKGKAYFCGSNATVKGNLFGLEELLWPEILFNCWEYR